MEKFKPGQIVKSGHYTCNFIVIGYKYDNYFLALREGIEDQFTNRELVYDKHSWLSKKIKYEPTGEVFEDYCGKPRKKKGLIVGYLYMGVQKDGTEIALEEGAYSFVE